MSKEIARILISGDTHASSKNYGSHRNYPEEPLYYMDRIIDIMTERKVTAYIGLGDLTYGRFHTLEYRQKFEEKLQRQYDITNGNRWEIKGNHDSATYGKTELEYYYDRGLIRPSENIQIGNLNISMVDYGKQKSTDILIEEGKTNIVLTHGFFVFEDSIVPDFGTGTKLDNFEKWFGVDFVICGHVHEEYRMTGKMIKDGIAHDVLVHYLPCLARPSYHREKTPTVGTVVLLTLYDNKQLKYETISIDLLPIEQSFNIEAKEEAEKHKELTRVDISDVVKKLDSHETVIGNQEDIIMGKTNIDIRYRKKAVELLKNASR